jgi:hypothetical protein
MAADPKRYQIYAGVGLAGRCMTAALAAVKEHVVEEIQE